jgi:GLPGLI family protein
MKKLFFYVFLTFSISVSSQANFQGKAIYMSKTTMDMNFGNRPMSEDQKKRIAERMKGFLEKTYILNFNKIESSYKQEEKLGAPGQGRGGRWGGMMSSFSGGQKYTNTKEGIVLDESDFFGKKFLISENTGKPDWKLSAETKKIGNYICYKATFTRVNTAFDMGSFGRRGRDTTKAGEDKQDTPQKTTEVTAWYTPQIPVSHGPGRYWGLPGLILELNEDRTTVLCTEINMNASEKVSIKKPTKGKKVTREEYNQIVTKKMGELREQFRGRGRRNGRG